MNTHKLKAYIGFVLLLLVAVCTYAQAPQGINYQAVVRNAQGAPIATGTVALRFTIHQGTATGASVFTEEHHVQPNQFGLVDVVIGSVSNLSTVNWANGNKFLQVELDAANGTNYTSMGTTQLMSVPYALHAGNAAPAPGTNVGDLMEWNGTAWVNTNKCSLYTYYYRDADGDGKGDKFHPVMGCAPLPGFVADSTDCNDKLAGATANTVWYRDYDGDGFGSYKDSVRQCTQPIGYVLDNTDCKDSVANTQLGDVFYRDLDNDQLGSKVDSVRACTQPAGYVVNNNDCNDNDVNLQNSVGVQVHRDLDEDGFGDPATAMWVCQLPTGYVYNGLDCDDNNAQIHPGAIEVCDGIDNDCDQAIDDGVDVSSDPFNCGACGAVCNLANANSSCDNGLCVIANCLPGFADVNGLAFDGCEVNMTTNCVINNQVFPSGATNPNIPCQVCNPALSNTSWSNKPAGTSCGAGTCDGNGTCVN